MLVCFVQHKDPLFYSSLFSVRRKSQGYGCRSILAIEDNCHRGFFTRTVPWALVQGTF